MLPLSDQPLPCELTVDQRGARLLLNGDVTIADALKVHEEAMRALALGVPMQIDLSNVTYLDAAMLQLLAAIQRAAASSRILVSVQHAAQPLLQDAQLMGMKGILSEDQESA